MINVLLNYYNFDGEWAYNHLERFVRNKRPLIIPLAYREGQVWDNAGWLSVYGKDGEKYDNIVCPFLAYGYSESDLDWLNFYDGRDHLQQIEDATLLFFTGGMPEKAVARMQQLGITQAVRNFDGVVMGASAGAMLQLGRYHVTPDEDYDSYGVYNGLGMVTCLDLEVHYLATDLQKQCSNRAARELRLPVYRIWHEGGVIVDDFDITPMGNVEIVKKP